MAMEVFKLVGRITYEGQQKVEDGLDKLGKKIGEAEQSFASFGEKAQQVGDATKGIGEGISQKVGLPLMALGGLGIKAASDIEGAFGKLAATTDRTEQDTKDMQAAAKDLWKNAYGADVYEAADAVATVDRNLGDLATSAEDVKKVTEAAFILKDAFGYEIQDSSKAAAQLMHNFGVTGTEAMDMIATAAQKGGDYSGELLDTVNEYSTYFGAAGFSATQMFDVLLAGAKNGAFSMDKVGDAVKEFNLRAKDGSKTTADGFAAIGLNADEMAQKMQNGGVEGQRAFMATIAGLSQMKDKVAMNQAGVALFGTQWEDLESTVMQSMGNSEGYLGDFNGKTKEMGNELYDNFGSRLTGAIRTFQDAIIPLGNILLDIVEPALAKLSTKIEQLSNWFGSLTGSQQKWIVILGLAAAALGPLLMVIGSVISAIGAISGAIAAIGLVTVGWIAGIAAIIAILVLAYAKFEWFRNGVNSVFAFIASIVKPIIADFVEFFKTKIAEMQSWWATNGAMIQQAFQNVWNFIKAIFMAVLPIIMSFVGGFIEGIKNIISGGLTFIQNLITFFAALFTGNWSQMWASLKGMVMGALQLIWGLFEAGLLGRVMGIIRGFAGSAGGAIGGFVGNIISFFSGMVGKVHGFFTSMVDSVLLKAMYGFDRIKSAIMTPISAAVDFVKSQVSKISGFFSGLSINFPKIKLPHFKLTGEFSLKNLTVPKLGVDWYKKGGVFGGPSVIGVGEQPGVSEAVIPLKDNVLAQIGQGIAAAGGTGSTGGQVVNHVHVYMDSVEIGSYIEPVVSDIQGSGVSSKNRFGGGKD